MDYFNPSPVSQAKKYAFKCHRVNVDGVDHVYPVNAIAFHPTYYTFASGGGDGTISIWDGENKKRVKRLPQYPTSIASISFGCDGGRMAIASSYTFEEGEKEYLFIFIYLVIPWTPSTSDHSQLMT